jgi:hypothetical protein
MAVSHGIHDNRINYFIIAFFTSTSQVKKRVQDLLTVERFTQRNWMKSTRMTNHTMATSYNKPGKSSFTLTAAEQSHVKQETCSSFRVRWQACMRSGAVHLPKISAGEIPLQRYLALYAEMIVISSNTFSTAFWVLVTFFIRVPLCKEKLNLNDMNKMVL